MLDLYFLDASSNVGETFTLGAYVDNKGGEIAELRAFLLPLLSGGVPLANSVRRTAK